MFCFICYVLLYTSVLLYADDILLYRKIYTEKDYAALQQDVDSLGVWSLLNHLSFNPVKCKFMVLSRKKVRTTPPPLNLLGFEIEQVDSIKYLGLTINDNLSWSDHLTSAKYVLKQGGSLVGSAQ